MKHKHIRMNDGGQIRHVPDYAADFLVSRKHATVHRTSIEYPAKPTVSGLQQHLQETDAELVEFVKLCGFAQEAAIRIVLDYRAIVRADFDLVEFLKRCGFSEQAAVRIVTDHRDATREAFEAKCPHSTQP